MGCFRGIGFRLLFRPGVKWHVSNDILLPRRGRHWVRVIRCCFVRLGIVCLQHCSVSVCSSQRLCRFQQIRLFGEIATSEMCASRAVHSCAVASPQDDWWSGTGSGSSTSAPPPKRSRPSAKPSSSSDVQTIPEDLPVITRCPIALRGPSTNRMSDQ